MAKQMMSGTGGRKYNFSRNSRMAAVLFAGATAGLSLIRSAHAAGTGSNWTGVGGTIGAPTSGNWSVSTNWDLQPSPGGEVDFNTSGGAAYVSTNDFNQSSFNVSAMGLYGTGTVINTIAAANASINAITFVNTSGGSAVPPVLNINGAASYNISAPVIAAGNITVAGTGTGALKLLGGVSGYGITDNYTGAALTLGSLTLDKNNQITIGSGATVISTGTITTTADGNQETNLVFTGAGSLQLRKSGSSATSPDINFNANDAANSTANWGTQINVPLDLGSSQRYFWGRTNHNGVRPYGLNADCVFLQPITGTGGMTFTAQATFSTGGIMEVPFVLAASNSFSGPVEIQRGAVYLYNNNALTQSNVLNLDPAAGNNAYFFLYGHSVTVSNLVSSGAGNAAIANDAGANLAPVTLTVNETSNTTFSGKIIQSLPQYDSALATNSGALSLVKNGPATLTLNGSNNYTGTTTIAAGGLVLGPNGSLASSGITLGANTFFNVSIGVNTLNLPSAMSLGSGSSFSMQDGQTGTFNLSGGDLTLAGANTLKFDVGFTAADAVNVSGNLNVSGTNIVSVATPSTGVLLNGTYNLLNAASVVGGGTFAFNAAGGTSRTFQIGGAGTTYTMSLLPSASGEQLVISGAKQAFWNGAASGSWTGGNWTSDVAGTTATTIPDQFTNVIFSVTGGGQNSASTTLGQDFTIGSLVFTADASQPVTIGGNNNLTIQYGGITILPGSGAHNVATSALTLGTPQLWTNNSSQPFTVAAPINGSSNTLVLAGAGPFVWTSANNANIAAVNVSSGSTLQIGNGGNGAVSGAALINNNGALIINRADSGVVAATVAGTGTITQNGAGTAIFAGNVSSGAVAVNNAGLTVNGNLTLGGALTVNSGPVLVSGNVTSNVGGIQLNNNANMSTGGNTSVLRNSPLNIGGSSVYQSAGTFNLLVKQNGGTNNQEVTGSGTLQLVGTNNSLANPDLFFGPDQVSNTYYGAAITVSTLDLGSTQRFIVSNNGDNSVANYLVPNVGVDAFISSNIVGSAGFNYQGNLYKRNSTSYVYAPLVLTGSNTFTGPVQVSSGSIYIFTSTVYNGQPWNANQLTLINNGTAGQSYSHFFLMGNPVTITNLSSSGTTQTNTGVANGNPHMSIPSGVQGTTLTLNQTTSTTFGGTIADTLSDAYDASSSATVPGALGVTLTGPGTLTLTASANYTGPTTVGTGVAGGMTNLTLAPGVNLANTAVTINPGSVLTVGHGAVFGNKNANTLGASLALNSAMLDLTSGGTATSVGTLAIHQIAGAGGTVFSLNNSTINLDASTVGADLIASDGTASVSGTNILNISLVGATTATPSTYNIITAPRGLTGTFQFTNGTTSETVPYGSGTVTLSLVNTSAAEELLINGGSQQPLNAYWNGSQGTVWATGGNGTAPTNFTTDDTGTTDTHFLPGLASNVYFTTGTGLNGNTNTTLGANFTINSLNFNDHAAGTGVTIGGNNTLTIMSGGINVTSGSGYQVISAANLVLGADQTWTDNSQGGTSLTVSSNISGGDLTIDGIAPIILLSSSNTYGNTFIKPNAILQLGDGNSANGSAGTGYIVDNGSLVFNRTGSAAINTNISGSGLVVQSGPGTVTLNNVANYSGGLTVNSGTLILANAPAGSLSGLTVNNGILQINPNVTLASVANAAVVNNGSLITNGNFSTGAASNNLVISGGTMISNGNLIVGAANNSLVVNAGNTLVSNGRLLLNGSTAADVTTLTGGGTVVLNSSSGSITTPDLFSTVTSNSYYGVLTNISFNLSAGTHYVGGVSGNNSFGRYQTGDLALLGSLSGSGNLVLAGQPYNSQFELRLGNDNSAWTGNLTITQGDIAATAANALTANQSVTFNPGITSVTNASGGVSNTSNVSALYLFGNNITIGSLSGTGTGISEIRNGAVVSSTNLFVGGPAVLTVTQTVAGTFNGSITDGPNDYYAGSAGNYSSMGITKTGPATLTLTGSSSYTGPTTVAAGQLVFARTGTGIQFSNLPGGLNINSGAIATVSVSNTSAGRTLMELGSLSLAGNAGAWTSKLDLGNNDLIVNNGSLLALRDQIKAGYNQANHGYWNGAGGIVSLAAAANTAHLTALGVIQNSTDQTASGTALMSTFDGQSVLSSDVLVKYTYYGDANLDGVVDGSDYSRIDNGFITGLTGWLNGDFNYDGVVDGSDYTLIDNAFNSQGASLAASIATPTAQIAGGTSAVPEPATLGLLGIGAVGLLGRRASRRQK